MSSTIIKVSLENDKIPMILITQNEYTQLIEENQKLKNDILSLYNNEKNFRETIKLNELTIDELKKENETLKKELTLLKEHIKKQDDAIEKLNKKMEEKENKELFNKFIIAIQDINNIDYLETKINLQSKQSLKNLKRQRINECHYLDNSYLQTEIDDRRTILLDKIKNMPQIIKNMFNNKFPNLLIDIEGFIAPNPTFPSQQTKDEIDDSWWN
jgi:hypothetical protein